MGPNTRTASEEGQIRHGKKNRVLLCRHTDETGAHYGSIAEPVGIPSQEGRKRIAEWVKGLKKSDYRQIQGITGVRNFYPSTDGNLKFKGLITGPRNLRRFQHQI